MDKSLEQTKKVTQKPIDELGDLDEQLEDLMYAAEHCASQRQRFALVVDATGSMSGVWSRAKDALKKAVDEIKERSAVPIQICVVGYRDHVDDPEDEVLEISDWSDDGDYLKSFIDSVRCHGGGDYPESIGHGLAALQRDREKVNQVILIGDAPSKLGSLGYDEAQIFGREGCPIYALYTDETPPLVECFKILAKLSGGKAGYLFSSADLSDVFKMIFSQNKALQIEYQPTSIEAKRLLESMK